MEVKNNDGPVTTVKGHHPAKAFEVIHLIKDLVACPELLPYSYLEGIGG